MKILYEIWTTAGILSFISLIICYVTYQIVKRRLPEAYTVLSFFLILGIVAETSQRLIILFCENKSNLFIVPIYYMLEYAIFSVLYLKYFLKKVKKISITAVVLIFLLVCIEGFRSLFFDQTYSFQAYGKVLVNAVIIVFCLSYFFNLARSESTASKSEIQLNTIIFIYYVLSLIIFVSINFLINGHPEITLYFWIFHSLIILLFYSSIAIVIWQTGKIRKLSPSGWQS